MGSGDPTPYADEGDLALRRWSGEEWLRSEVVWDRLLARSNADPLFLSWEWLTQWWRSFGRLLGGEPDILAFYRGGELSGIAPLYRRRMVRNGVLPTSSVQLIGLSWRDSRSLISEYLDVIAAPDDVDAVRHACVRLLAQEPSWTECIVGFTPASGQWREAFSGPACGRCYIRDLDRQISYQADLSAGFAAYLQSLGQSTRRSVWNLRKRLALRGAVSFEFLGARELSDALADLNRLHQMRWHRPAFSGAGLSFHTSLAGRLAARGELAVSRLRVAGEVVSVLYDIRKGACQYNISMGFNPEFNNKLSLGLLHLGYAMEAAAERGIHTYDFLAGSGQRSDYKRYLGQRHRELSSVQVLRGPLLPSLYRWRDRVRGE